MGTKKDDPNQIRNMMLDDMPIEQFEQMMGTANSRADEMWNRSREAMDPESEMNQRKSANIMAQNQDMIATQMRMQQANAARAGMGGSGIAAAQSAALGLQGQQQGLMAVQQGLDASMAQGMQLGQMSGQQSSLAQAAGGSMGQMIGGANQAAVNTQLQNTANQNAMTNTLVSAGIGVGSSLLMMASDRRLKKNITKIGENSQGYNVYEFQYIAPYQDANDDTVYVGVMADEVHSDAVQEKDGIHHVDYSQIDLEGFI